VSKTCGIADGKKVILEETLTISVATIAPVSTAALHVAGGVPDHTVKCPFVNVLMLPSL
jgi:hypothetical protein